MAIGTLLQGSSQSLASIHAYTGAVSRSGRSCIAPARCSVPTVPCKYDLSVASSIPCGYPVFLPSGDGSTKRIAPLMMQIPSNSCRTSRLPEHWIEDCINDIVKHIHEAPFLQMLFNHENASTVTMSQLQRVPVSPSLSAEKKWSVMKNCVDDASADAVILVHNLGLSHVGGFVSEGNSATSTANIDVQHNMTNGARMWGVLVVGRTIAECACYILETTRVASTVGICTHYCLRKAQTFGPSWIDQIRNGWLFKTEIQ